VAAVVAVVVLGLFDLSRPAEDRSHLGRLFERVADDGANGLLLVINRKLAQNLRTITDQPWTWLLVTTALALGYLMWRHRDRLLARFTGEPELRAAGMGLGVAMVLGFALNDSGVAVPGMILAMTTPIAAWFVFVEDRTGPSTITTETQVGATVPDEWSETGGSSEGDRGSAGRDEQLAGQTQPSADTATSGTLVTTPSTPSSARRRI
jgi:hypothetical protein